MKTQTRVTKSRNKWKKFLIYIIIIIGIIAYTYYYLLPILKILFAVPSGDEMHVTNASAFTPHSEYKVVNIQSVIGENSIDAT